MVIGRSRDSITSSRVIYPTVANCLYQPNDSGHVFPPATCPPSFSAQWVWFLMPAAWWSPWSSQWCRTRWSESLRSPAASPGSHSRHAGSELTRRHWSPSMEPIIYLPLLLLSKRRPWYLVKCDLLVVPVLDVEEQNHATVLVSALQNSRVTGLDGAAYGLRSQILKQLRVILPETHVTYQQTRQTYQDICQERPFIWSELN